MGAGVDVDMQARVQGAQFRQLGEQALRAEQRQHAQPQAQHLQVFRLAFHRHRQRFQVRGHRIVEIAAVIGQPHGLAGAAEHLLAGEVFEVTDSAG